MGTPPEREEKVAGTGGLSRGEDEDGADRMGTTVISWAWDSDLTHRALRRHR